MLPRSLLIALCVASALSLPAAAQQDLRIAGVVLDSISGTPVPSADVTISPVAGLDASFSVVTSSDGRFLFAHLAPGKYQLRASRAGYVSEALDQHESYSTAVAARPGLDSEHIRFLLAPQAVISGTVTDEQGDPVRHAQVLLFRHGLYSGSKDYYFLKEANTDDLGNYRFAHLPRDGYSIAVFALPWYRGLEASAAQVQKIQIFAGDSSAPRIVSSAPADVVYPVVFYPNASGISSAAHINLLPGSSSTADFSLQPVPAIHLLLKSQLAQTKPEQGRDSPPDQAFTSIAGSFQVEGVELTTVFGSTSDNAPGDMEFSGLTPGTVVLNMPPESSESQTWRTQTLDVASDAEISLNSSDPRVSVSGVVSSIPAAGSAPSNTDPPYTSVTFSSSSSGESFNAIVSPEGEFSFSRNQISVGTYKISLSSSFPEVRIASLEAEGALVSGESVTFSADHAAKLTIHTALANCQISGTAMKNGKPFAAAMIVLVPEDKGQTPANFHRDQSDSDGTFTMSRVLPGRYTLLALENGWDLEWSSLSVLFPYLPAGVPLDIKPASSISTTVKVQ